MREISSIICDFNHIFRWMCSFCTAWTLVARKMDMVWETDGGSGAWTASQELSGPCGCHLIRWETVTAGNWGTKMRMEASCLEPMAWRCFVEVGHVVMSMVAWSFSLPPRREKRIELDLMEEVEVYATDDGACDCLGTLWKKFTTEEMEWQEVAHLLRVMADGHRKARRGRNLFCKQGVWREVIGLETYSSQ